METVAFAAVLYTAFHSAMPLLLAGLGELVSEKSGVLNLGVEGMMLAGAVVGFIVGFHSGSFLLAAAAAAVAGGTMAALFGVLTVILRVNQVASGLALTIFGIGLSAFLGQSYTGEPLEPPPVIAIPLLSDIPFIGRLLFAHDALVYFGMAMLAATAYFLSRSRWGLVLRAVGENHHAAHSMGYAVALTRFAAIVYGGAMCGLGGAYLSLVYTPLWAENMTAGRGWIALALVVFSAWLPWRLFIGAYLFGFIGILQLFLQGSGVAIAPQFLAMTPYLATIAALAIISGGKFKARLAAPRCLGKPFPIQL